MGEVGARRHLETHANRNPNFSLTSSKRTSHSTLYKSQAPPRAHRPHLPDSLSLSFATFASLTLLPGFTDQRREQLHQRRSGGVEMKRCVAVGKHLATVKGAEGVGLGVGGGQMCCRFSGRRRGPSSVERCCYDVEL